MRVKTLKAVENTKFILISARIQKRAISPSQAERRRFNRFRLPASSAREP